MKADLKSCLVVGSGLGGLALGALLARRGVAVTVLEAHPELVGGYAHTIHRDGYRFAAGPRYLWNFGEGQIGRRFLEACGLAGRVRFVELDRAGFDRIYVGDDEPIAVPNGWEAYGRRLADRFPAEADRIARFFALCRRVFDRFEFMDEHGLQFETWGEILRNYILTGMVGPIDALRFVSRAHWTLQDAFDHFGLSRKVRSILYAHGLIFAEPADAVSFYAYVAGTLFYHRGCFYPEGGMECLVDALVGTIRDHGGSVVPGARVVEVDVDGAGAVRRIWTASGAEHSAEIFVANIDPRTFLGMVRGGRREAGDAVERYRNSGSLTSVFLGVRDATILRPGFGRWNIWYVAEPGATPEQLYLNSPTLVMGRPGDAPPGGATVTAFVPSDYRVFRTAHDASPGTYEALKRTHLEAILDLIERRFIPGLRESLEVVVVRTPLDNEAILHAPGGNVYGRSFRPREVLRKLPWRGPYRNLYFVGSAISFAGVSFVIHGACRLYEHLGGDRI